MRRSITILMAALVAVGMLASFAGPVAAQADADAEAENEVENEINQDQNAEQRNVQIGVAGDDVKQYNDQDIRQRQYAEINSDNTQDATAVAAALELF